MPRSCVFRTKQAKQSRAKNSSSGGSAPLVGRPDEKTPRARPAPPPPACLPLPVPAVFRFTFPRSLPFPFLHPDTRCPPSLRRSWFVALPWVRGLAQSACVRASTRPSAPPLPPPSPLLPARPRQAPTAVAKAETWALRQARLALLFFAPVPFAFCFRFRNSALSASLGPVETVFRLRSTVFVHHPTVPDYLRVPATTPLLESGRQPCPIWNA
ncbi:uncharacterized protein K452DRAFT_78312 [Aplosporella prunicola CBS 121167]|uniref:Uncharacterized protein n=1 Tax=Aplosporella prunicola CBS 121167 TaxID=1176127 RepID=A0A6A6B4F6_9PEZI|nr:uncharacterized protein K452DRAFT_78312 [Aplosporella prunicola CBS 121167]KAF2138940.1 hypothetical protein K452DRAFT_78312 [Aplosporella prunicola CBS 121167]